MIKKSQWHLIPEPNPRVEIIVHKFKKPFLGGYRQPETGFEFHNATTQTLKGKNKDWNSFSAGKWHFKNEFMSGFSYAILEYCIDANQ